MSGVEAAASLFDSEDAAMDPFAMLGTNSSEHTADNLFSGVQEYPPMTSAVFDAPSQESSSNGQTYSNHQDTTESEELRRGHDPYGYSQNIHPGRDSAGSLGHGAGADYNRIPHAQPSPLTTTSTYTPQTYQPPIKSVTGREVPVSTTSSYGVAPTPQTYNPTSTSSPYHPPAPTSYPMASSLKNTPPPPPPSTYSMQSAGSVVRDLPPSRSTPPASTLNRPKLTNAYDPPFLPSKLSKRPARPAEAHLSHNASQTPPLSGTYTSTTVSTPTPSGGYLTGHPPVREQYGTASPQVPFGVYSAATPMRPSTTSHNAGTAPYYAQSSPYVPIGEASPAQGNDPQHSSLAIPPPPKRGIESNPPERYPSPPGIAHPARSHTPTPRSASAGSNSSQIKSEQSPVPANMSPPSVPLPHSPSEPKFDPVSNTLSYQESVTPVPQHDAYAPLQASKKAPAPGDPYVPATIRNLNHIPRTASPLHNEYIPSGSSKVPTALNLNGTLYNALPRAAAAIPVAPYSLGPMSNATVDTVSTHALGLPQEFGTNPSLGQYAPSPSLVGANDPLSRTSTRAPVVSFGFGGKIVTCFHGMPGLNAGFDIAFSARNSSELKVRVLQKILPESTLNSPGPAFPGPLVSDPDTPSLSLVISGASSHAKTKKAGLVAYLSSRAEELNQGLGYLSPAQRPQAEHKLILVKLLRIMVENDGRLLGIPQSEMAVRTALVSRLEAEPTLQDGVSLQAAAYHPGVLDEAPISVTNLRPSELSKIEEFLLRGDRRQAYRYALDRKLWAHAMVIASSIDRETWKEAVNDFLHQELAGSEEQTRNVSLAASHSAKRSWESLRMTYSFFSGQGSAAIQELAPLTSLQRPSAVLQPIGPPVAAATTPRTPNFMAMQPLLNIPSENLVKWAETVAMMISSPFTPSSETSSALVALGDQLLAQNWIEAAHACYLLSVHNLSSQTPFINGIGAPGVRITLLGSRIPGSVSRDPESLFLSEILEFALSLLPSAKGLGLPHLQAYRLVRAVWLAEMGDVQLASRYCEAIAASLSQTSPYSTPVLLEQLNGLQERLTGVFNAEKSNSWIAGKISKPSLDSIGGWLEGRFTKLVTGDNESTSPKDDHAKVTDQQFVGPFAHYSTISSTTPSSRSSPQPTTPNITYLPPPRTSSAMGTSSPYALATIEKASPGVTPMRNIQTGISSTPSTFLSSQSSTGYGINGYADVIKSSDSLETPVAGTASGWWGSNEEAAQTPTAATFLPPENNIAQANSDGFISLMDSQSFIFESKPSSRQASSPGTDNSEDEDLGFGNSKPKQKAKEVEGDEGSPVKENTPATAKPAEKAGEAAPPAASGGGSWFSWFKRSESSGPVKANLGEQSTFYYDKDLKRWVDKKTGGEAAAKTAQPPPPPPRAQTASPGMSASRVTPPPSALGPPRAASAGAGGPPRPASAIDSNTEPPTKVLPPRIRSNLAPPAAETVPSPQLSPVGGPPPARPRSQATKRNVRNRYVDVFQQENGGASTAP